MKKLGKIFRIVVEKLIGVFSFIILYLPITLGILAPMGVLIGWDFYISWRLIGYGFTSWTWYYYLIPPVLLPLYIFFEIAILCIGLGLFLAGLLTFIREKVQGVSIVRSGIYKYIRHPQNLGILLMVFPFTLYVPGFRDIGIRMGDIASWMLFTFILCVFSYYEEWRLLKKFTSSFSDYYTTTGFMTPKIYRTKEIPLTLKRKLQKVGIFFVAFVLIFVLFYSLVLLSQNHLIKYR